MSGALTAEALRAALVYDSVTGAFTRRVSAGNQAAGSVAGTRDSHGYVQIRVHGRLRLAHRLAWLYMTGAWPAAGIDHIDGRRDNNRWANLREATQAENTQNNAVRRNNKCGLLGVSRQRNGLWRAQIQSGGKRRCVDDCATPEEAHAHYLLMKAELHAFSPKPRQPYAPDAHRVA
jgi:hypothetical protein